MVVEVVDEDWRDATLSNVDVDVVELVGEGSFISG